LTAIKVSISPLYLRGPEGIFFVSVSAYDGLWNPHNFSFWLLQMHLFVAASPARLPLPSVQQFADFHTRRPRDKVRGGLIPLHLPSMLRFLCVKIGGHAGADQKDKIVCFLDGRFVRFELFSF